MRRKTAQKVSSEALVVARQLNDLLQVICRDCPKREFERYREGFGHVLGNLLTRVLLPIFDEHPSLAPAKLRPGSESAPTKDAVSTRARRKSR